MEYRFAERQKIIITFKVVICEISFQSVAIFTVTALFKYQIYAEAIKMKKSRCSWKRQAEKQHVIWSDKHLLCGCCELLSDNYLLYNLMDFWWLSHFPVVSKCERHYVAIRSEMRVDFVLWDSQLSGKRQIIIAESNLRGSVSYTAAFLCPIFEYYQQARDFWHCCRLWLHNVKSIPGAFQVSQMKNTSRCDQCTRGMYDCRLVPLS